MAESRRAEESADKKSSGSLSKSIKLTAKSSSAISSSLGTVSIKKSPVEEDVDKKIFDLVSKLKMRSNKSIKSETNAFNKAKKGSTEKDVDKKGFDLLHKIKMKIEKSIKSEADVVEKLHEKKSSSASSSSSSVAERFKKSQSLAPVVEKINTISKEGAQIVKDVHKKNESEKPAVESVNGNVKSENKTVDNASKDEVYYENLRKKYLNLFQEKDEAFIDFKFEEGGSFFKREELNGIMCGQIFYTNHIGFFLGIQLVEDAIENETYLNLYLYSTDLKPSHPDVDWTVSVEASLVLESTTKNESRSVSIEKEYKKYTGYGSSHLINLKTLKNLKYGFINDNNFVIKGTLKVLKPIIEFVGTPEEQQQRILLENFEKQPISERLSNFERF